MASSGLRTISKERCRIGLRDLVAGDDGEDETKERDEREHEDVLIVFPGDGVSEPHTHEELIERQEADYEKEGDKPRR